MSALEVKRVRGGFPSPCEGLCAAQGKSSGGSGFRRQGSWQVWVMGRDGGRWCDRCVRMWRNEFEGLGDGAADSGSESRKVSGLGEKAAPSSKKQKVAA